MPIIRIINIVIEKVGQALQMILMILPDSPFIYVMNLESEWLGYINYFFPFTAAIAHLELFLLAVALYYVIRIALRWVKGVS